MRTLIIIILMLVAVPAFAQTNWVYRWDTSTNAPFNLSDNTTWHGIGLTNTCTGTLYTEGFGYTLLGADSIALDFPTIEPVLTNATTVWLALWLWPSNSISNLDGPVEFTAASAGAGFNARWDTAGHDGFNFGVRSQPGDAFTMLEDTFTWTNNTWTHIIWEWALARNCQKIWINGVLNISNATALASTQWKMTDFSVANLGVTAGNVLDGQIDDVKMGTNVLTEASVAANYALGRNGTGVDGGGGEPGAVVTFGLSVETF